MTTYAGDISSVLWLYLTALCDNVSNPQLFCPVYVFYEGSCPVPEAQSTAAPTKVQLFLRAAEKDLLLCLGWL